MPGGETRILKNVRHLLRLVVPFCLIKYYRPAMLWLHECMISHVRLFVTLQTVACQAPLSMGFSRQEYWSGFAIPFSNALAGITYKKNTFSESVYIQRPNKSHPHHKIHLRNSP